jgi:hypothetical protein
MQTMNNLTIFILIDALGWHIQSQSQPANNLITRKLDTVLGFSSSAIPTILTGTPPATHGRWNLLYRSPESSPFFWTKPFGFLPRWILEHRITRKFVNELSKRLCGAEGYFSSYGVPARHLYMYDVCEKSNIYKPGGIEGSTTIIDYLSNSGVSYQVYSYHDTTDNDILESIALDASEKDTSIYFAYLSELDAFLHKYVDQNDLVIKKVDWYFYKINNIVKRAVENGKNVRLFIFSDHGMTPITAFYDLMADLLKSGIDLENDCMAAFDSTMARFWVESGSTKTEICRVLNSCPAGHVLMDDELLSLGVFFPDHRYGDIIFLMNPGTLIFPNWFGTYAPKGMHGFHPNDKHSHGVYISNVKDYSPSSILDLFDIMKTEVDRLRIDTN